MKAAILISLIFCFDLWAKSLSFEEALDKIIERSSEIPAAVADVEASKVQLWSQRLSFVPTLSVGRSWEKVPGKSFSKDSRYFNSTLNLFKGGSDLSALKASKLSYDEKKMHFLQKKFQVEERAIEAILNFILNQKKVEVLEKNRALKVEALKIAKLRYKKGLTPLQEVHKSEVDLGNGEARLSSSKQILEKSRSDLISLLGSDDIFFSWPWINKLQAIDKNFIEKKKFKLEFNPSYKEASFRMEKNKENLKSSLYQFSPKVDLAYTYSRDKVRGRVGKEELGVLSISFPLFNGLKDTSTHFQKRVQYELGRHHVIDLERKLTNLWTAITENLLAGVKTVRERLNNLKLSRNLYKTNQSRFFKGRISVNDLQFDQNRLLDSENLANEGIYQLHLAFLKFCHHRGIKVGDCW